MVPTTSSPSASLTRTRVEFSINCLRYFASSKVCSGARADFPGGGVTILLKLLFRRLRLPVRGDGDAVLRGTAGAAALDFPIIAVACRYPQIGAQNAHFQFMEAVLGQRDVL